MLKTKKAPRRDLFMGIWKTVHEGVEEKARSQYRPCSEACKTIFVRGFDAKNPRGSFSVSSKVEKLVLKNPSREGGGF
jgi:hypothetical protein